MRNNIKFFFLFSKEETTEETETGHCFVVFKMTLGSSLCQERVNVDQAPVTDCLNCCEIVLQMFIGQELETSQVKSLSLLSQHRGNALVPHFADPGLSPTPIMNAKKELSLFFFYIIFFPLNLKSTAGD